MRSLADCRAVFGAFPGKPYTFDKRLESGERVQWVLPPVWADGVFRLPSIDCIAGMISEDV